MRLKFWKTPPQVKAAPNLGVPMYQAGYAPVSWKARTATDYAEEGYLRNAVAYACVNKIAQGVASVDLSVARYVGMDKQVLENHPLYELLERPNPRQAGAAFFRAVTSYKKISGNAFILRLPLGATKPTELWTLRPDRVKIVRDDRGEVSGYEYGTSQNKVMFPVNDDGSCDVLHLKEFHPLDDWNGLSPMQAAACNIDIVNSSQKWNASLLENGARPSGAFVMKADGAGAGTLSEEQFNRLREQIDRDAGSAGAGRPLILEGGMDWRDLSLSPRDMDFKENMWAASRMIATAYGVPPQLINIPGESTYSNMSEAKQSLWQETILPELDATLDELNNWLTPLYADDIYICYEAQSIPALQESIYAKYEKLQNASFMTDNEKRAAVGLPAVDGGDVLLADANRVPLSMLSDA